MAEESSPHAPSADRFVPPFQQPPLHQLPTMPFADVPRIISDSLSDLTALLEVYVSAIFESRRKHAKQVLQEKCHPFDTPDTAKICHPFAVFSSPICRGDSGNRRVN